MNSEELANLFRLAKLVGGKFIIVEDGKPSMVLLDYREFSELAAPAAASKVSGQIERINRQITTAQLQDLREEVIAESFSLLPDEAEREGEITIEPLDPH